MVKGLLMLGLLVPSAAFVSRAPIVRTATVARSKHVVKVRPALKSRSPPRQRVSTCPTYTHLLYSFVHSGPMLPSFPPYKQAAETAFLFPGQGAQYVGMAAKVRV